MNHCFDRVSFFMNEALVEARKSFNFENIPVGCLIVKDSQIICRGYNSSKNSIYHAEIICISNAMNILNSKYLDGCEIFITLEPCEMCYNAILISRISKIFFGAFAKEIISREFCNYYGGFVEKDCALLLIKFFMNRRSDYLLK